MIVGLTGLKHSGKDTVAAYLVKEHGYERRAYADPVKKHIAGTFGIPFSEVDKYKNNPHISVWIMNGLQPITHMTFREFIQRDATEGHRDVPEMGTDFWVELTLPHTGYYVDRNMVITDVRFDNEAYRVHGIGGKVVEIVRPRTDDSPSDPHRSEAGLSFDADYTIFNNGTVDDLGVSVQIMLEQFESQL